MRKNLNINMCKAYVNYKSLFIEWQCYTFMSLAQGSCAVAASSRSNNMSTAEGNVNVKNLVQTIVQHLAFRETINSILTTTNQEQLPFNDQCSHHIETSQLICSANQQTGFYMMGTLVVKRLTYIVLIVSAEIPKREGSIYPSSFYRQLPNY